ncbi:MAG: 2-phospho-L-lactate transferase [Geminicoccales bacterium]
MKATDSVIALSGGIGGAKLALGLDKILPARSLMVVCNTGDDFEHLGLTICPDLDTVMYTLAGIVNPETGWGRANETWTFIQALEVLGGETWFQLGDNDLATHIERTRRCRAGNVLTEVTRDFCKRLKIETDILPMCDQPVRTMVATEKDGVLPFQRYFVERRAAPRVTGFVFEGAAEASVSSDVSDAFKRPELDAVVICPSNPFISIDPILAVPGMRQALRDCNAPIVAVSPIIGGKAVKGPTAKMMTELGLPTTSNAIASHYDGLLDGLVIDETDEGEAAAIGLPCLVTPTLMRSEEDKKGLAARVLDFVRTL